MPFLCHDGVQIGILLSDMQLSFPKAKPIVSMDCHRFSGVSIVDDDALKVCRTAQYMSFFLAYAQRGKVSEVDFFT